MKKIFALIPIVLLVSEISSAKLPASSRGISKRDDHVSVQSAPSFWSDTRFKLAHVMELGQMVIPKSGEILGVYMKNKDNLRRSLNKLQDIVQTEFMKSGLKFFKQSSELADIIRGMSNEMNGALYGTT
ncbi:hypothetical protein WA026_019612 [Henosepilachna vigintioctopunctata]|uniref:Uncharacterized protein n=1 Tax=Henosepilachna vigintioctopunctata TaxID=420089 RepID=A0AAW1TR71_9CUCU